MSCSQGNHGRGTTDLEPIIGNVPLSVEILPSPYLIASNAPENVTDAIPGPSTLLRCSLPISFPLIGPLNPRVRLFIWHIFDGLSVDVPSISFGLACRTTSGEVKVSDTRQQIVTIRNEPFRDADLRDAGICLSKAVLFQTMDAFESVEIIGQEEALIWECSIDPAQYCGVCAVVEFTLDSLESSFQAGAFRTVVTTDTSDWGLPTDDAIPPGNPGASVTHIRGAWPYSSVKLTGIIGALDACGVDSKQFTIADPAGADVSAFLPLVGPPLETEDGNKGLYGTVCEYEFEVSNKCPGDKNAFCYLLARNVGAEGKFWGAAQINDFSQLGVAKIRHKYPNPNQPDPPLLNCSSLNEGGPILIPEFTDPAIKCLLRVSPGGAAELPVNFVVSTEQEY